MTAERSWLVRVRCPAERAELVAGELWALGASAIEERAAGAGDHPGPPGGCDDSVRGYVVELVAGAPDEATATSMAAPGSVVEAVDPCAWVERWRPFAPVTRVGEVVVRPPWVPGPPAGGQGGAGVVEVVVDPATSFGHGGHPSTRLALAALLEVTAPGATVLDVGCGSGVLAVAAAVARRAPVMAIDVDPGAVAVTEANAVRNGVARLVRASTAPLDDLRPRFDVVVANLLASQLRASIGSLAARAAPGGSLVVSGMLESQLDPVASAAADRGLAVVTTTHDEGWVAAVLRARPAEADEDGAR